MISSVAYRVTKPAPPDLDVIPVYRQVKCPLLVVLATDDLPEQQPFQELYAAHRRGLEGRLVAERLAEMAQLITRFAAPPPT